MYISRKVTSQWDIVECLTVLNVVFQNSNVRNIDRSSVLTCISENEVILYWQILHNILFFYHGTVSISSYTSLVAFDWSGGFGQTVYFKWLLIFVGL